MCVRVCKRGGGNCEREEVREVEEKVVRGGERGGEGEGGGKGVVRGDGRGGEVAGVAL